MPELELLRIYIYTIYRCLLLDLGVPWNNTKMFYSRGILILSKDRADVKYVEKAYAKHTRVFLDTCLHVDTCLHG